MFNIKFYNDELPKTLPTNYFTILQRRYPEEQDIMTIPGPLHKEHPTKLRRIDQIDFLVVGTSMKQECF